MEELFFPWLPTITTATGEALSDDYAVFSLSFYLFFDNSFIHGGLIGDSSSSSTDGVLSLTANNINSFSYIACHPAAVCLEALLSFMLQDDDMCLRFSSSEGGEETLTTMMSSIILTVTSTISEALMIDANIRDFEIITKNSQVLPIVDSVLSHNIGCTWQDMSVCNEHGENDTTSYSNFNSPKAKQLRLSSLRNLRDHLFSHGNSLTSGDVLLLSFLSLQVVCRHLVKSAILLHDQKNRVIGENAQDDPVGNCSSGAKQHLNATIFPASSNGAIVNFPMRYPDDRNLASRDQSVDGNQNPDLTRLLGAIVATFERTGDKLNEACAALLCRCNGEYFENNLNVIKRTLNMLAEVALSCGLLGLHRQSDLLISTLSRFSVPVWQFHDIAPIISSIDRDVSRDSGNFERESLSMVRPFAPLKRRHIQCFVRLSQVVHVLADTINDWDTIMDCFEQIVHYLVARHRHYTATGHSHSQQGDPSPPTEAHLDSGGNLSVNDTEKIFQCIERFKGFTVFMSDETIVKLMTSLVALSVNSLSITPSHIQDSPLSTSTSPQKENGEEKSADSNPISISMRNFLERNLRGSSDYMLESLGSGCLNYSLHMAIEIVKINAFRVSCIWQMATSHLRILASHKMARTRKVAVAATIDIITTTLEYMRNPSVDHSYTKKVVLLSTPSKGTQPSKAKIATAEKKLTASSWIDYFFFFFAYITDESLYEHVLPPYQTAFMGRAYQETTLKLKSKSSYIAGGGVNSCSSNVSSRRLQLTQADLLSSLRGLANIRFPDVRTDVMMGLLDMLQGGGQAVTGGWGMIIELLTAVPESLLPVLDEGEGDALNQHRSQSPQVVAWPIQALLTAFSCLTLIVDDFLEILRSEDANSLTHLVTCLSMFSRQSYDVNISLTSVQMLWKVTDFVMTASREQGDEKTANSVLNVMLQQLLELSLDLRPEIRNCATNTLFSAIVSNASMLSNVQWLHAYEEVIFPLFLRMESRSKFAMHSNEQALAPEIKKGVKMTVHHSRDTAHKQWSETRVLALRGLSRVIKICLKTLMTETWFQETWLQALDLCIGAVHSVGQGRDLEVSLAGVDTIFDLLKLVSTSDSYKAKVRAAQGMRVVGGALVNDQSMSSHSVPRNDSNSNLDPEDIASREQAQQSLWHLAWSAVKGIATVILLSSILNSCILV